MSTVTPADAYFVFTYFVFFKCTYARGENYFLTALQHLPSLTNSFSRPAAIVQLHGTNDFPANLVGTEKQAPLAECCVKRAR